jgi:hypothetical protein
VFLTVFLSFLLFKKFWMTLKMKWIKLLIHGVQMLKRKQLYPRYTYLDCDFTCVCERNNIPMITS